MGNLGSRKKPKEDELPEDVWMKLNDGQPSPKNKKKKKKKRKKKGKRDSPDRCDENTSQCDSYSQSTLSSRKLSDSTIASTGTITHHNTENETKPNSNIGAYQADDQSNCSIGYVTASDTFTPPSPRKGRQSKFSPVIAQDSPRVVRRLLQSEKILENKEESPENLSPRARFFLSTPETSKSSKAFENKKYYRYSSGSSIDSRTFLGIPDEKSQQSLSAPGNDNRYITNSSLIVKSRQQENKNSYGHDRRFSYNNEMSDSTTENLVKTGEKAKLIRYDNGNMSPAERRKNRQNDALRTASNDDRSTNKLPFVKYDREHPTCGVRDDFIDFIITKDCESEALPSVKIEMQNDNEMTQKVNQETHLCVQGSQLEIVPPPSPASGVSLIEIDESDITESESCSDKHLSKDDEHFGDSVCKRLSLLLESEQDKAKLNRSEFNEFTDSHCSSPDVTDITWEDETFNKQVNGESEQICDKHLNYKDAQESKLDCNAINSYDFNEGVACESMHAGVTQDSKLEIHCNEGSSFNHTVKTPQGQENASVWDVMNNNFRMKTTEDTMVKDCAQNVDCAIAFANYDNNAIFREKEYSKQDQDIEEQMRYENEINEKLIEERFKTLNEILPPQKEENKRHSWLCAINNKHANDPDNYILVTKKTFCVKRGILVELLDEEKDVIARDAKIVDDKSAWITTGSEQMYRPDSMIVQQGRKLVCSKFDDNRCLTESDISDSVSEPDYVNMDDFERQERKCYNNISPSDEEIDFENVLNRSQSQSDSECSDMRPKRESDILCDVIDAYKDEEFSEYSDEVSDEENPYIKEPIKTAHRTKLSKCIQYSDEISEDEMLYVDEARTHNRKRSSKHIQNVDDMSDDEIISDEEFKAQTKKTLLKETRYSDELSEDEILYDDQRRTQNMKHLSKRTRHSNEISDDKILYVGESIDKNRKMPLKYSQYSDEISDDEISYVEEPRVENRKKSSKHIQYSDEISDDEIYDDEILYVEEPITQNRKIMLKDTQYSDEISEDEILYVDAQRTQNMPKMSKRTQYSDEISDDEILYVEEQQTQNRKRLSKHRPYSDDLSDDEILYDDTPQKTSRKMSSKVVRIPSKLDQSLQKIFQEKQKQLALSEQQEKVDNLNDFEIAATAEVYDQLQAAGYDSPHQKSSEGSRRSLAYTESDLDASEKWDDDDNASNDSMLADDEYDDDEIGEIIFSKPYIEHDEKADAMFSYNMVKTLPESPVVWEPEADDDDVFQDTPIVNSGYHEHAEDSIDSSDEAFDDARKQMQEIHEQLQTLREQMVTFENEEEESSVPPSPLDDRILNIQKASSD